MAKVRSLFWGIFICSSLVIATAAGQSLRVESGAFQFPNGKNRVRVPFKFIHNLVIIPVQINNSKPFHFVLDTGVDRTLLVEVGLYDSIALHDVEYLYLRGLGKGAGIEAILSNGNTLKVAGVEARQQQLLVLEQNIFNISAKVGMEVNGIIGYPLFKEFVVEIDYANKMLSLYKPGFYPMKRAQKAVKVPLTIEDKKPYLKARAVAEDGKATDVKLIVDSGMSSTMLLYPTTLPPSFVPHKTIESFLGNGLNGEIHGEIGRIKAISIGGFELENPTASFPDSLSVRHALTLNNRNGNLGADILHRFRVVFDYANSQMLLTPNYYFKKPFYFNLSGMEVMCPLPGHNFYAIANVFPDSPADKAGLKKGDNIVSINGEKCFEKSFTEVLDALKSRPGRKIKLKITRDLKVIETILHLEDVI
ncbi:PDZ domain-containing protein [Rufibacter roseus]|uniref:PDZ domain-containing protein n=1 Tax=Rufibacter roseus TaxID=1567108 RepID=A0ABW2DND9_9BACT|nr:PDZ domain-containing protein [Rufibacter roseus]